MRFFFALLLLPLSLLAELNVAVTYPYIGALAEKIGQEHVDVSVLAPGNWDPHFVVPRPSLIAKLRRADLLVINGADLEIGWLGAIAGRANNARLENGGTLELAEAVTLKEVPRSASRAGGDVHPQGNPHFHLDPNTIPRIAAAIADFFSIKDPQNAKAYAAALKRFEKTWRQNLQRWAEAMEPLRGTKVVQYHTVFNYFLDAYGIKSVGTIEPLPGIPPSSRHTLQLIETAQQEKACCILHDVYHATDTAEYIAKQSGMRLIILPHDVEALDSVDSIEALFDYLTEQLRG